MPGAAHWHSNSQNFAKEVCDTPSYRWENWVTGLNQMLTVDLSTWLFPLRWLLKSLYGLVRWFNSYRYLLPDLMIWVIAPGPMLCKEDWLPQSDFTNTLVYIHTNEFFNICIVWHHSLSPSHHVPTWPWAVPQKSTPSTMYHSTGMITVTPKPVHAQPSTPQHNVTGLQSSNQWQVFTQLEGLVPLP